MQSTLLKRVKKNIKDDGFHITGVFGSQTSSPFAYTIGLEQSYGHPELLITGIDPQIGQWFIRRLVERINIGESLSTDSPHKGLTKFPLHLREVDTERASRDHMLGAENYYGGPSEFRALQIVYPDPKGRYPWDAGYHFPPQDLLFG